MQRLITLALLFLLTPGCASLPSKAKSTQGPLPKSEAQAILRRIDTERDQTQCQQAIKLWEQGKPAEAQRLLDQVLARNPEQLQARRLLADLALDRGDAQTAEQILVALVHDHPEDQAAQASLAWLYESQDRSDLAQGLFEQLDPEFTANTEK